MKKLSLGFVFALLIAVLAVAPVAADSGNLEGGAPAAHGVDGKTFGTVVSGLAQSAPGALAVHTSGGKAGGMPAAHGVDGKTFGFVVSGLAQADPGALAAHVSGK
jgi:hypothetical protein